MCVFNEDCKKIRSGSLIRQTCHFFRIKYERRCLCVCVCVRVVRLPWARPPLSQVLRYFKKLIDEVVKEIKNDFLAISVIWKIWIAKMVLLCLVPQNF